MNEELEYAEMLEIPVETITVSRKGRKKKEREQDADLQEQLVREVNERMETEDPAYAESTQIVRESPAEGRRTRVARRVILGEFIAVCALCATIFLTNIFLTDSAINTFVRGLFRGNAAQADERIYSDFALSPVFSDGVDAELIVSDAGVLSFTRKCSVYPPVAGVVTSVSGNAETGYTVEVKHSESFSTIIGGLDFVYCGENDDVKVNLPIGFSDGEGEVRVMFYSDGTLLNCLKVSENTLAWN